MNREILVHIKIHMMVSKSEEFKLKLERAYEEFKLLNIKDKKIYNISMNPSSDFTFEELTYFDKMKDKKYREMIERESDILLSTIRLIDSYDEIRSR